METLDVAGAAKFLNVDSSTVKGKASKGEIVGAKVGRAWVFRLSDLDDYLIEQATKQTAARKAKLEKPVRRMRALPVLPDMNGGRYA